MINIIYICNNYGSQKDGIGAYSKKFYEQLTKYEDLNVELFTAKTDHLSKFRLFLSFKMVRAIKRSIHFIKKNRDKYNIILEYPFVEYNPLILHKIKVLKKNIRNEGKIILSLHEYSRVKKLRKFIIRSLIKKCDVIYVTSEKEKAILSKLFKEKEFYIRDIPSNIDIEVKNEKDKTLFTFFGLINSSKAFDEMIESWKRFNIQKKYHLNIITSSEISNTDFEKYGIHLYKGISDLEIATLLSKSQFCFTPIIPFADRNNGTLKTACLYSNICIGKFSDEISENIGCVPILNYDIETILDAIKICTTMTDDILLELSTKSNLFGKKFSFETTVEKYMNYFNNEVKK